MAKSFTRAVSAKRLAEAQAIVAAMPVALLDLDNTIVDYSKAMSHSLNELASPAEKKLKAISPSSAIPPYLKARRNLILRQPGWWQNLPRFELGFLILRELKAFGFTVHVVTKGPWKHLNAWTEKAQWCRTHIPEIPVTITQEKSLIYGRVLVDDWAPYYEPWLKVRTRGLVVVPAQPWNLKAAGPGILRFTGTKDLPALRRALKAQVER